MRRQGFLCVLGCCLLLYACVDTTGGDTAVYVVQPQDTLYSIAWRYNLDFHDLARWNNVGPDFRIKVGEALRLSPGGPNAGTPAAKAAAQARRTAQPGTQSPSGIVWAWPTDCVAAPQTVPGGGILIAGSLGQEVRAAAAGRVVYAGSGIRGYGNLIIIKHGENLLSAYAHNRESLVHDGQEVALGQLIGHMGEGAPQKAVLYFEIRRNGKPVDPIPFLPR